MTTARATVPARVHLAGNPSDGYGGAVVSTVLDELSATVTATLAESVTVRGPESTWPDIGALAEESARCGHDGGDRLVTAALVALDEALPASVIRRPLHVDWSTSIPRSVGLGGSSAIVIATIEAALGCWSHRLTPDEIATIALAAETDHLGIAAGLADRAAQAWRGTVLTDCRPAVPTVSPVEAGPAIEMIVAWSERAAAPSGDYHAGLRSRAADPEHADTIAAAMGALAAVAEHARVAIEEGDGSALGHAMDGSLRLRRALGPVPPATLEPVEQIQAAGGHVNLAGSGGAVVIVGPAPLPSGATTGLWESVPMRPVSPGRRRDR